jgi:hypothetical protein
LLREGAPYQRIDAIGTDHQIRTVELVERGHRAGKFWCDPDRAQALLQQ